ncbi:MAG: HDIG domain-containing protein [Candidatus Omnitrophica bacterium]|nr:HDIG domain-containing protein [Candidatus Omnitrophota bacterium]MBU1871531.1 HDIG domain-containing protein [Candidatus Omnitrophota bacterium]
MRKQVIKSSLAVLLLFLASFILKFNLLLPLMLVVIFIFLETYNSFKPSGCRFSQLLFLFLVIFAIGLWCFEKSLEIYFIPFVLIPMLVIILWQNLVISLLMILACGFSLGFEFGSLNLIALFFISGIISTVLLVNVRRRSQIIRAGFIAGLFQSLTWALIQNFRVVDGINPLFFFFINGAACGIAVVGFLPVFEYLFGIVTNISLLELSDFNSPVLKRLMLEAPGTYHHSLVVGNLSEAACEAVNANALLARIGSYYHDIGKIDKSEYFIENQKIGVSKHEDLTPSMSKLVIINHVKEGELIAKRFRINPRIIDFIRQHHGTSLVYYFYRRALENEEGEEISEEGFRYPGPKPMNKETAIVLLADSVEAATRALKEPTPNRIEQEVQKIINNKFIDGQLDECDLTLKDLEKISGIFIRLLTSIYHSRVNYTQETRANNHHKPTKEDSHQ